MEVKRDYWKDGKLQYEYPYQNGKRHGIYKYWRKDGQLEDKEYYLYNQEVSEKEYQKHQLIAQLAGISNGD